jgi:hypothetical protein
MRLCGLPGCICLNAALVETTTGCEFLLAPRVSVLKVKGAAVSNTKLTAGRQNLLLVEKLILDILNLGRPPRYPVGLSKIRFD